MSIANDIFGDPSKEYAKKILKKNNPFLSAGVLPHIQDDNDAVIAHSDVILNNTDPNYITADAMALSHTPWFRAKRHGEKILKSGSEEANTIARGAATDPKARKAHQDAIDQIKKDRESNVNDPA